MTMNNQENKSTQDVSKEALELYISGKFPSQGAIVRHLIELYPYMNKEHLRVALLRRVQRYKRTNSHPALNTESGASANKPRKSSLFQNHLEKI